MDEIKALAIVSALANGVNPQTGEIFPADSAYQTADVIRALFLAVRALETKSKARSRTGLPANTGKPWSAEEDQRLLKEFDEGGGIAQLAQSHGRTAAGIQARLGKHGRLQPSDGNGMYRRAWRPTPGQRVEDR